MSTVYENKVNQGEGFVDFSAGLTGVERSSVAWGDYDNDGDPDILLTGANGSTPLSKIYENRDRQGGGFVEIASGLPDVYNSSVAWGDYDNDGDLDILLTGVKGVDIVSAVYRERVDQGGGFVDIGAGLPAVGYSSVAWGDYDNDGDLDILLTGDTGAGKYLLGLRQQSDEGGGFVDIAAGLTAVYVQFGGLGRLRQRRRPGHPPHRRHMAATRFPRSTRTSRPG